MLPRDHYLKQAFQDTVHFPKGFEKGGLSDIQARLIRKHGTLISAITIDEVSDATPDDLHILKVIASQSSPKNPVEQAWIKYLSIIKKLDEANSSKTKPSKAKAQKAAVEQPSEPEAEPEKKVPETKAKPTKAKTTEAATKTKAAPEKPPAKKTTTKK